MIKLRRHVAPGERPPWWYGIAWFDFPRACAVCYPIPINIGMRWLYATWVFCLRPPPRRLWIEKIQQECIETADSGRLIDELVSRGVTPPRHHFGCNP